jgi:hypothetical protein
MSLRFAPRPLRSARIELMGTLMRSIRLHWGISAFLGIASLLAVYLLASPGVGNDWILDLLTGLVAAIACLTACSQLAQSALNGPTSR